MIPLAHDARLRVCQENNESGQMRSAVEDCRAARKDGAAAPRRLSRLSLMFRPVFFEGACLSFFSRYFS